MQAKDTPAPAHADERVSISRTLRRSSRAGRRKTHPGRRWQDVRRGWRLQVISAFADRDRRAQFPRPTGVLFDEYARAVCNLGFRLTADWSATEAVSLTFLEAWRKRGRIEAGGESLRPLLLGIAVTVSRNLASASRPRRCASSPRS
jgi:hypothetical protein